MKFLMIDGTGDPNTSSEYRDAISALYSLAYALKSGLKKSGVEFKVSPLEGLWWADDMAEFSAERKGAWHWTMMIAQPNEVTPEVLEKVVQDLRQKKSLPALQRIRLITFAEGAAAQILHVGPYAGADHRAPASVHSRAWRQLRWAPAKTSRNQPGRSGTHRAGTAEDDRAATIYAGMNAVTDAARDVDPQAGRTTTDQQSLT